MRAGTIPEEAEARVTIVKGRQPAPVRLLEAQVSAFNGVKVFLATVFSQRQVLGETVTRWLEEMRGRPGFEIVDIVTRQSSDRAFHCTSITVFYIETTGVTKKRASP
jgi:hypothetical protein